MIIEYISYETVAGITAPNGTEFTEENWSDVDKATTYAKSKTLAEKAAWEFVKNLPGKKYYNHQIMISFHYLLRRRYHNVYCHLSDIVKLIMSDELKLFIK